jgi:aminopeptidase N
VADGQYDSAKKTYTLHLTQSLSPTPGQAVKEPMVIPLRTGLVAASGADLPLRTGGSPAPDVITLTGPSHTIVFEQVA